jgi:hypothetical protein
VLLRLLVVVLLQLVRYMSQTRQHDILLILI